MVQCGLFDLIINFKIKKLAVKSKIQNIQLKEIFL